MISSARPFFIGSILVATLTITGGCGSADSPASAATPTTAKGGTIAGSARTADGRPIGTFEVSYDGWPDGALGTMQNGRIASPASGKVDGKDGRYSIKLPAGQYTTEAMANVTWHDKPYTFKLEPADGSDDSSRKPLTDSDGISRDYVWKLTGVRPGRDATYEGSGWDRNFYGATVGMDVNQVELADRKPTGKSLRESDPDASVEFTLVPSGKLIDGSDGKTIVEKIEVKRANTYSCGIRGIPTGDYKATAKLIKPDGTSEPLRVTTTPGTWDSTGYTTYKMAWATSADVVFPPADAGPMASYGTNPVSVFVGR